MGNTSYSKDNVQYKAQHRDLQGVRVFGIPNAGVFTFAARIPIYTPPSTSIHFFEELTFSANVSDGAFSTGLSDPSLQMKIYYEKEQNLVFRKPLPLNQYLRGLNLGQYHFPNKNGYAYFADIVGELKQSPQMLEELGDNDLILSLVFTICGIDNRQFNMRQ